MSITRPAIAIVATPIGNLGDISQRAIDTLRESDLILAEDTRVSKRLLQAIGVATPLRAFHGYNENASTEDLLTRIGRDCMLVSLISDAGTPLISDPGFPLIRAARQREIAVTVVPGPCAAIAALVLSGLPTEQFVFAGFLPARSAARCEKLRQFRNELRTVILYEAPHRLHACLDDARRTLGDEREVFIARELTKLHETCYRGRLDTIGSAIQDDAYAAKGELVIVLGPAVHEARAPEAVLVEQVLQKARGYLSLRDAAALTSEITGVKPNAVYAIGLDLDRRTSHTGPR